MRKRNWLVLLAMFALHCLPASAATPVGNAFTYQGLLQQGNSPINALCDFQFSLWDANLSGVSLAPTQEVSSVSVSNGVFMVQLDFGGAIFDGNARWLEIGVRTPSGAGDFTVLSPRQALSPTPYAIQAATAAQVSVTSILGTLNETQLPANVAWLNRNQTFLGTNAFTGLTLLANAACQFSGDGAGVTNLNVTSLVGQLSDSQLSSNVAFLSANQNFSGTNIFATLTILSNGIARGIFVGDGAGLTNLNIQATNAGAMNWVVVNSTSQNALGNNGYLANSPTQVSITLPDSSALTLGSVIRVAGAGEGGWKLIQASNQSIITRPLGAAGGFNWIARGPSNVWKAVACSADGTKLVASPNQFGIALIFRSTNSGLTWQSQTLAGGLDAVASSADGTRLVACAVGASIWISTNSGSTWTERASVQRQWTGVASSADGSRLVAVGRNSQIYTSTDFGTTWTPHATVANWLSVASSADGLKLVAGQEGGQIYTSINGGINWTPRDPSGTWSGVASSSDGSRLIAVDKGTGSGGRIWLSHDYGNSWGETGLSKVWTGVASSADGSRLFAAEDGGGIRGRIHSSIDGGSGWAAHGPTNLWRCVTCSADGGKVVAAESSGVGNGAGGFIYTSGQSTSIGTGGLFGDADAAVELQYIGNDRFRVLSHEGTLYPY